MVQVAVNGVVTGLAIALLALAFSLVYLPTRVFHVALGACYAAAPYVLWTLMRWGWGWFPASLAALGVAATLSLLCEVLNHAPLEKAGATSGAHLITSLGIYIVVSELMAILWGSNTKVLRQGIDASFSLGGGVTLSRAQAISAIGCLVLLAAAFSWFRQSLLGLQFRAMAANAVEFSLRGYPVPRIRKLAFALAGALSGIPALLTAHDIGFDYRAGLPAILLALVALIAGGQQSFLGPVLGGILLGILRGATTWWLGARWQDAVTFLILALFLLFRPAGILGRRLRQEAEP